MKNTRVVYQYRDAANHKFPNEIIISGHMGDNVVRFLIEQYGEGSDLGFDPCKMKDVPAMAPNSEHESYDPELDHPFHEICLIEQTDAPANTKLSISDFLRDIKKATQ